jgi:hypothetical protein
MRRAEWIAGHRLIVAVATLIAIGYLISSLVRGPIVDWYPYPPAPWRRTPSPGWARPR